MNYGYVRVSSLDQNEARQLRAMKEQGLKPDQIFIDKQSGKDFERPNYQRMLRKLREGDLLFILSIDRLGRNYAEILEQWRLITKRIKADVVVLDMPLLDTRREKSLLGTFMADLVLQILSFVAESERESIRKRQAQGIAAAKERGVVLGRRPRPLPENFADIVQDWQEGTITGTEAAKKCQMPLASFRYRARKMLQGGKQKQRL
ncbi:MAG: recombinase family protein [Selenomonadaceae bacterium]|nr:recombinase family protein [Selenomonadaceae bacterium]